VEQHQPKEKAMKTVNGIDIGSLLMVEAEIPPVCHIETHEPSEPFLVPAELNLEPVEGATIGPVRYPATEDKRFVWSPAVQLIEVELDVNSDKSCNNEKKPEGNGDANPD
jgi:hypothetical protein